MKISITLLALLGLSCAHQSIVGRTPPPPGPPIKEIQDLIVNGIKGWGPASNLKPPSSPKPPLREMPFGLGLPKPPHKYPPGKTGVSRIPGSPLGPQKKCRPCKRKRQLCCSSVGNLGRPIHKLGRIGLTKAVGKAAAFSLLAPHARELLEAIKDSPVGAPVRWFDDAMASVQEAIGGPLRSDIDGNELKAWIICAFKGGEESEIAQGRKSHFCTSTADEFNQDFEDAAKNGELEKLVCTCAYVEASWTYPQMRGGSPAASDVSDRMCKAFFKSNQYGEFQWKRGLNELMDVCSNIETNPDSLGGEGSSKNIKERCATLQAEIKKVEKGAEKPGEGIPMANFGSCKCDAYKLSKYGQYCGNNCRALYFMGDWRLNIVGDQPKPEKKPVQKKPDTSEDKEHQELVNQYCAEVREQIEAVSPEKPGEGIPMANFGSCKCDAYKLSKYGQYCGNNCRALYFMGDWRLNIVGDQPKPEKKPVQKKPDTSEDKEHQELVNQYFAEVREQIEAMSPETLEEMEDPAKLKKDIKEEDAATQRNEDIV